MTNTGRHKENALEVVEAIKQRGIREHHTETRAEHLPDDIRDAIQEIRQAIPEIFGRLDALENRAADQSEEPLTHLHAAMAKMSEALKGLIESKKQLGAQGADIDGRLSKVESQCVTILRTLLEFNNAIAPLKGKEAA